MPLLIGFAVCGRAQTVVWQMAPTDAYKRVVPFAGGLFQATGIDGRIGYIDAQGAVVVPVENDALTPFYEDRALLLCHEGDRDRIVGCLTRDGHYTPFATPYYTLEGQEFFSEGLLTVEDAKGLKGYIDTEGRKAFGFTKKHRYIKPFHEGYAAVCTEVYHGVPLFFPYDKKGVALDIAPNPGEQGDFTMTNFDQGLSYVLFANSNQKVYTYNLQSGQWRLYSTDGFNDPDDYLYRYGKTDDVQYQPAPKTTPDADVQLTEHGGRYGFRLTADGRVLLPAQLQAATPFADRLSVVQLQGKTGLLRYEPAATPFAVATPQATIEYYAGQQPDCAFSLAAPAEWADQPLTLTVSDGAQTLYSGEGAGSHTFAFSPHAAEAAFGLSVSAAGLQLWADSIGYTFRQLFRPMEIAVSIPEANRSDDYYVALDNSDNIPVTITVTNPNDATVTVTVTATGSDTFVAPAAATLTLEAHKSATVGAHFHATKRQHTGQSVTVSVATAQGGSQQATLGPVELRSNF